MSALAHPEALLEERVERGADGLLRLAQLQRLADLPEDLPLTDDHRVEAGRDREEVVDGSLVVVDVEGWNHIVERGVGTIDQEGGEIFHAPVEAVDLGVDLHPVAGGQHQCLGDVVAVQGSGPQLGGGIGVDSQLLEQLHRC